MITWDVFISCPMKHAQRVVGSLTDADDNIIVKAPDECQYCLTPTMERELTWREKRAVAKAIKKLERL